MAAEKLTEKAKQDPSSLIMSNMMDGSYKSLSSECDSHDTDPFTGTKQFQDQGGKGHSDRYDHNGSNAAGDSPKERPDVPQPQLYYGIGNITKPIGVPLPKRDSVDAESAAIKLYEAYPFNSASLGGLIKDQSTKIKVRPVLVSFGGLPESGKSRALDKLLAHHVSESPFKPIRHKSGASITHYELIADGSNPLDYFMLAEAMKESSFAFGVLSAFKRILATKGRVPVLDQIEQKKCFENGDLDLCFQSMFPRYFCSPDCKSIPKDEENSAKFATGLKESLPEGLALVNIWDHSISNTVRHLLSALQGHLYNHHMLLFLDLKRDLEKLDDSPEIANKERDGAVFMIWRPRLHYLLRSCWASEGKGRKRRNACTIFAKIDGPFTPHMRDKVDELEDMVNPVARHIGVDKLLDKKIEAIDLSNGHKRLYQKIQHIISDIPYEEIPLSWVFLRSSFNYSQKIFVSQEELKRKAMECGMSDESLSQFRKFYTSFGSIIDLSLVNSSCKNVIVKPIDFLKSLDELMFPKEEVLQNNSTIKLGIFPHEVCKKVFKEDLLAYMEALISLNLTTQVTSASLQLPPDYHLDHMCLYYYIPLSCRGPLVTEVDSNSVHLITNIDTPHFFKQVTLAQHLLSSLTDFEPKLVACDNINQTVIKASGTTVTLAFHSPVIKIHMDKPDRTVCSHVIEAFNKIANYAFKSSGVKVKYKFVRMCAERDVCNVESLLSSSYHILPHYGHCETCRKAGRKDGLLKMWNEALEEKPISDYLRPSGEIHPEEISAIAGKIASYYIDPGLIAETFVPDKPQLAGLLGETLVKKILTLWYDNHQKEKHSLESRHAFAEKLSELGKRTSHSHDNPQKMRERFEKLAKSVDAYWRPFQWEQEPKTDISSHDLRGVKILSEIKVTMKREGSIFSWEGYGLKIAFPSDAISDPTCEVHARVLSSGQYELPEGYELVSSLYWLYAPQPFLKAVDVEIQHCCPDDSADGSLFFIKGRCDQELPYKFKCYEGSFAANDQKGLIPLSSFSILGVVRDILSPKPLSCCAVGFIRCMEILKIYDVHILVFPDLEMYHTTLLSKYTKDELWKEYTREIFRFCNDSISFKIPNDDLNDDWECIERNSGIIKKELLAQSHSLNSQGCYLTLKWVNKRRCPSFIPCPMYSDDADICTKIPFTTEGQLALQDSAQGIPPLLQRKVSSAEAAIMQKKADLIEILSFLPIFGNIVSNCEVERMVTRGQSKEFLDTFTGKSLEARVRDFIDSVQTEVKHCPDDLDVFLCILHEKGNRTVEKVAKSIATEFGGRLPHYEALSSNGVATATTDSGARP